MVKMSEKYFQLSIIMFLRNMKLKVTIEKRKIRFIFLLSEMQYLNEKKRKHTIFIKYRKRIFENTRWFKVSTPYFYKQEEIYS